VPFFCKFSPIMVNKWKKWKAGRDILRTFRDKIKDPIIAESQINPVEYKAVMGPQTTPYRQDDADGMIIAISGSVIKSFSQLKVFWLLYSCRNYEQTRQEVPKPGSTTDDEKGLQLLGQGTIRRYERITKKAVKDYLKNSSEERNRIREAIRDEYARRKTR
jgi:hypothetical protein